MVYKATFRNEPDYKLIAKALKELYEVMEAKKMLDEKKRADKEGNNKNNM